MTDPRDLQIQREEAARQAALGRRMGQIDKGHLGPILRRWVNADVVPIAVLMRGVARAYLDNRMDEVGRLLDTPASELDRERPLGALMEWLLRGSSPGRAEEGTHAEDLALSFMAALLSRLTRGSKDQVTVGAALAYAADALRDTVQGQFLTGIQGAKSMQKVREREPYHWQQKKSLSRICSRLMGQVRPILLAEERGEIDELPIRGNRKVVQVMTRRGDMRRVELKAPDPVDWHVMSLCWRDENSSGTSPHRSLWLGFAGMFLAAAQKTGGWFEVAQLKTGRKGHTRTTKYLVLSDRAHEAIKKDAERWMEMGFHMQPMLVPPEGNDYLTVKHRKVAGQFAPLGLQTDPSRSSAWTLGAGSLSSSPWTVNTRLLEAIASSPDELVPDRDTPRNSLRLAEHKRLATSTFYLPTVMDFRGRLYYRTAFVSPQSDDLGKALLCFPPKLGHTLTLAEGAVEALEMHLGNLAGVKGPLSGRSSWLQHWAAPREPDYSTAEKPLTLRAAHLLLKNNEWDRIPVQLDGSCNGLQHLTALLRDEVAAPLVNLTASSLEDWPGDAYGEVARRIVEWFAGWYASDTDLPWASRLDAARVHFTRELLKGPVMVLPYGGTREAVRLSLKAGLLKQLPSTKDTPWHSAEGYEAFRARDLTDHPLFNQDLRALTRLVWDTIGTVIPRAMAFMRALQEIGAWIGERGLSWQAGVVSPDWARSLGSELSGRGTMDHSGGAPRASLSGTTWEPLWVVQAKSKAQRKQVTMRGFHLPNMVRRLTLMSNRNEVDPKAHRAGIVANFIHSLDAAHLAASVATFRGRGGSCVGAVHDCLLVRPSEAALMHRCLRETFVALHEADPLAQPVRLYSSKLEWEAFPSWYALAEKAGVAFPERGTYDVRSVLDSTWFFS